MTSVSADLLSLLDRAGAALALPRVRALHLPAPAAAGSRDGEFCAIELDDGSLGLSFVLFGDTLPVLRERGTQAAAAGAPALDLARGYVAGAAAQRDAGLGADARRALGFAAVNALTRHLFDRAGLVPPAATGSLGELDLQPGDHLGMIGLFPPLVPQVLSTGAALTVFELRADLAGARDGWRVTLDAAELAGCNKVLATSTLLLNDTLDATLARCRHVQRFVLIGPGAGCLPDPLFERGVTLLGGNWIVDAAGFKAALHAGAPWGRFARKFALGRDAYPGFVALLARAQAAAPD